MPLRQAAPPRVRESFRLFLPQLLPVGIASRPGDPRGAARAGIPRRFLSVWGWVRSISAPRIPSTPVASSGVCIFFLRVVPPPHPGPICNLLLIDRFAGCASPPKRWGRKTHGGGGGGLVCTEFPFPLILGGGGRCQGWV